jgi:myo-inositol-1(or 4)-monophosphatase
VSDDLRLALDAARRAASLVAGHFRSGLEVRYKDPEQPVTEADLAADAALREDLLGARPAYGWLSEESRARSGTGRTWMVDPIDGTNSFVAGIPEFGVSVGLVEDGRPVVGVVVNPATGDAWWAAAGAGAFLNGAPIRVSGPGTPPTVLVSRDEQRRGRYAGLGGWVQVACGSTAVKMCRVAQGAADSFLSFGPKHLWDVCAADLIAREAGARVTGLAGEPIRYEDPAHHWRGMAVAHPALHDALLRAATGSGGGAAL